jgi:hypothetical protein
MVPQVVAASGGHSKRLNKSLSVMTHELNSVPLVRASQPVLIRSWTATECGVERSKMEVITGHDTKVDGYGCYSGYYCWNDGERQELHVIFTLLDTENRGVISLGDPERNYFVEISMILSFLQFGNYESCGFSRSGIDWADLARRHSFSEFQNFQFQF